jgi:putative ABC transport system permease protein
MYESKATIREEFSEYEKMFLLVGGVLCAIIGLVGILNFFNAIMTGILSRRHEFAVLQSVGMTNRQLRTMLMYEGLFYVFSSVVVEVILSLVLMPLLGNVLGEIYWFCEYQFTILPIVIVIPVFVILGVLIPRVLYGQAAKQSVVERLREAE